MLSAFLLEEGGGGDSSKLNLKWAEQGRVEVAGRKRLLFTMGSTARDR